ncbi:MAG: SPOR domain-containing protein [Bacteroidia bacterium]|nr:SPOR domain-containing protein [Bacteroidia bacterium]
MQIKCLHVLKTPYTLPEIKKIYPPFFLILLSILSFRLSAQITMECNLPDSLPTNTEKVFEVKITKGELNNFAKYQIELPEGAVAEEGESRGGTFSYENKRAKIVWVIAPPDSVFTISMKLITGPLTGPANIEQKFSYIVDGNRKEVDAASRKIYIVKVLKPERKMISGPKTTDLPVLPNSGNQAPPSEQAIASNQNLANQGSYAQQLIAMRQQANQFRLDSKKAYELGSKEKTEAEKNAADAEGALTKAQSIQNETERNAAIENAKKLKERAASNNSAADKILALSRTLENEAIDLETAIEERTTQLSSADSITYFSSPEARGEISVNSQAQSALLPGYENKKIDRLSDQEIAELKQQAAQFRKDAAEAMEVGLKEKEMAGKKLQEAEETIRNAEDIKNKNERKKVLTKAEAARQKAETDLQTSEKIIILSRTLNENADEIERLIEYIQPSQLTSTLPAVPENTISPETAKTKEEPLEPENLKPVDAQNTVYMLQVGAFINKPDKTILKKLGKYKVVNEDNKYKVLVGPFSSREDALKKREELITKGFDGFVVIYEKGKRK